MKDTKNDQIYVKLMDVYNLAEENVKTEAKVKRAYIDKISEEIISDKVNNQLNSIKIGISNINSKYKEGSKNYDKTKTLILETMTEYEKALIELTNFFDGKMEQLILQKVELEAGCIGSILNEEYLYDIIDETEKRKNDDIVKNTAKFNFANAFSKLIKKKEANKVADPQIIKNMIDSRDIQFEVADSIEEKIVRTMNQKEENSQYTIEVEKKIVSIDEEINILNERKIKSIYNAMEIGDKALTTDIRRPRAFSKITKFFLGKFNTAKAVENTIILPLKLRIENFKNNELSNIQ